VPKGRERTGVTFPSPCRWLRGPFRASSSANFPPHLRRVPSAIALLGCGISPAGKSVQRPKPRTGSESGRPDGWAERDNARLTCGTLQSGGNNDGQVAQRMIDEYGVEGVCRTARPTRRSSRPRQALISERVVGGPRRTSLSRRSRNGGQRHPCWPDPD